MNRAEQILALVTADRFFFGDEAQVELLNDLGDREDEELVEIMRGCASTLAYRSVTHGDRRTVHPTPEVYIESLRRITTAFAEHVKKSE